MNDNWYALFVKTGEEDNVKERLNYRFEDELKVLVPKRKLRERKKGVWNTVIRTLFPGYVLVNGHIGSDEYYRMKNIPGLLKLLKSEHDPLKIEDDEIEVLERLICNSETIEFSNILIENGKVIVVDGPLTSLEGQIISINKRKGRAKVSLEFMGEERVVELGVKLLEPR